MSQNPYQPSGRANGQASQPSEVYIEFQAIGPQVRVTAMDAASGIEVFVVGPVTASRSDLQTLAIRKLQRRMAQGDDLPPSSGRGILA